MKTAEKLGSGTAAVADATVAQVPSGSDDVSQPATARTSADQHGSGQAPEKELKSSLKTLTQSYDYEVSSLQSCEEVLRQTKKKPRSTRPSPDRRPCCKEAEHIKGRTEQKSSSSPKGRVQEQVAAEDYAAKSRRSTCEGHREEILPEPYYHRQYEPKAFRVSPSSYSSFLLSRDINHRFASPTIAFEAKRVSRSQSRPRTRSNNSRVRCNPVHSEVFHGGPVRGTTPPSRSAPPFPPRPSSAYTATDSARSVSLAVSSKVRHLAVQLQQLDRNQRQQEVLASQQRVMIDNLNASLIAISGEIAAGRPVDPRPAANRPLGHHQAQW